MNLELPKPPIGAVQDKDTWVYLPSNETLNDLARHYGPQRTAAAKNETSNAWQTGHTDVAADILGVAAEAYTQQYMGFDPYSPTFVWVYQSAPPVEEADFGGRYEVKRTNDPFGALKYRTLGNADHDVIQVYVDAYADGDDVDIHGVYLIGWNQPRTDHAYSRFYTYDSKGREVRSIQPVRRRPMDTLKVGVLA